MAGFPKIYTLICCPKIVERDKAILKATSLVFDIEDCFSLIHSHIWFHPRYKLYVTDEEQEVIEQMILDAEIEARDEYPISWNPPEFEDLFWKLDSYVVDNKYDILMEYQRLNWNNDNDRARILEIQASINYYIENYQKKVEKGTLERSKTTKWTEKGYSASTQSDYREMQPLLWRAYDEDSIKYSYEYFDYYCCWANRQVNQELASIRREKDKKSFELYVKTGMKVLIPR